MADQNISRYVQLSGKEFREKYETERFVTLEDHNPGTYHCGSGKRGFLTKKFVRDFIKEERIYYERGVWMIKLKITVNDDVDIIDKIHGNIMRMIPNLHVTFDDGSLICTLIDGVINLEEAKKILIDIRNTMVANYGGIELYSKDIYPYG